ncbi:Protein Skeletor, isoforms B/C [Gryllus bimaculatus]|nr:Protein Skeletor, isoforms B/C [Gryllus bimaculatus]
MLSCLSSSAKKSRGGRWRWRGSQLHQALAAVQNSVDATRPSPLHHAHRPHTPASPPPPPLPPKLAADLRPASAPADGGAGGRGRRLLRQVHRQAEAAAPRRVWRPAYFYAGDSKSPNGNGFRINDEKGSPNVLPRYRNKHITLTLPENKTLRDIRWFSVWCDEFSVNFGDVRISKTFEYPRPQKIDALSGVHGVSSENIVVVDAQTLLIPSFSYDGEAPDAKFWVGRGAKPSPQGARVPDENGKEAPLRRYDRKTIVLTLPGDLTVYDIGHFGVWCEAFTVDFGHVRVPRALNVPPSLKMLGVSPQSKLNCEVLWDENAFEVRWAVAGDSVVIQLVGKIDDGEYMSFGLSGSASRSRMVGGDVAVVWVNHSSLAGDAQDYFLESKSQCAGENTNSIRLLNAAMVNGYSIVTYQRPLHAKDELDHAIVTNGSQAVIWALGPLNSRNEVSYHRVANRHDVFIDFARSPKWNCPIPDSEGGTATSASDVITPTSAPSSAPASASTRSRRPSAATADAATSAATTASDERVSARRPSSSSRQPAPATPAPAPAPAAGAWDIPAIQCYEPEDGVFYAQMGPTGGKRGYSAITGHVGWGISWYINGLLIPEINVVRGKTYTFVVEGGNDPDTPARYHPFYITDDPVGGYQYKTPEERNQVRVFAGVRVNRRGEAYPTGTGRLCNWTPDQTQPPADEFASFGAYQRTLSLECDQGEAGVVQWTPDHNTPDTVYYQCYTHRYLGWRINVYDSCDSAAASETVTTRVPSSDDASDDQEGELQSRPSIRVTTRVKPDGGAFAGDKPDGGANAVDKLNLGEVYLPPAAYSPPAQQYIPLSSQEESAYTVQPGPAPTDTATEQPLRPSPLDFVNPGTAHETATRPATPHSILPSNASKTTDVKLLASTAKPAQSTDHDHTLLDNNDFDGYKATSEASPTLINSPTYIYKRPLAHRPHGLTPHGYILPNGRPASMATHTMMLHRPQGYNVGPYRRPVPHRGYVPLHRPAASMVRPTYSISTPLPPNYLMTSKKPFYRVTMMGVPHRTMVSPPPFHRPMTTLAARPLQYSSSYKNVQYSLPPQRIKYDKLQAIGSTSNSPTPKPDTKNTNEAKKVESVSKTTPLSPAPLLSTSTESISANLPIAVNTGFRPETVVVEGGFKPIIKNVAQDRSSVETDTELVDQDEIMEKLEKEMLGELVEAPEAKEDRKENPFEGQRPETFEPMFIPSPPDRISQQNASDAKRAAAAPAQKQSARPRPRPAAAPPRLAPSFRSQQPAAAADAAGEMAMAAERMDTYYLPPVGYAKERPGAAADIPPGAVVAYDGKSVVDVSLASSIADPSASTDAGRRNPPGTAELIKGTPQFGPYHGEVPPPVPKVVHPESIPQLQARNKQQAQVLPVQFNQRAQPHAPNTRLALADEALSPAGSEIKELYSAYDSKQKSNGARDKQFVKKASLPAGDVSQEDTEETTASDKWYSTQAISQDDATTTRQLDDATVEMEKTRLKREALAHHEPGHTGTGDEEDHSQHEHRAHDHAAHDHAHMHDHGQAGAGQAKQTNVAHSARALLLLPLCLPPLLLQWARNAL